MVIISLWVSGPDIVKWNYNKYNHHDNHNIHWALIMCQAFYIILFNPHDHPTIPSWKEVTWPVTWSMTEWGFKARGCDSIFNGINHCTPAPLSNSAGIQAKFYWGPRVPWRGKWIAPTFSMLGVVHKGFSVRFHGEMIIGRAQTITLLSHNAHYDKVFKLFLNVVFPKYDIPKHA